MSVRAPYGWTVVKAGIQNNRLPRCAFRVYKRDCPADAAHFAADLAQFTHTTAKLARQAGKRGDYAYKCVVEGG